MKRLYIYLSLVVLLSIESHAQESKKERYVILISIDGFRPEFYLDSTWKAPTLQRLMREGVYAQQVKPVYPSVTYPNHISMITGVLPNKHGIYYNRPAVGNVRRWNSGMIKTPTVFDAVNTAGLSSAALFWPVTAQSSIHYNVPTSPGMKTQRSTDFMNRVASPGLWKELEQNVTGKITPKDIESDVYTGMMAAYLIQTYKPSLMAIHLVGIDHAQHKVGLRNQSVEDALSIVDNAIKTIVDAIDQAGLTSNASLLIVGDHGFHDVHSSISPNVWLKKKGIYKNNSRWKAKFYTANSSAILYLNDPTDERTLYKVKRILEDLPEDQKALFRIIEREELISIGGDPDAVLALNPVPGIAMQSTGSGKVIKPATGAAHGYFADFPEIMAGFIGWGSGLNTGTFIQQMSVPDIAPIIARLLEIDFPAEDGVLNEELFYKN